MDQAIVIIIGKFRLEITEDSLDVGEPIDVPCRLRLVFEEEASKVEPFRHFTIE